MKDFETLYNELFYVFVVLELVYNNMTALRRTRESEA